MAMKAIRNPTLINGFKTWYVSHHGNDLNNGETETTEFKTIAKATSVATAGDNIMLDDGIWSQQRTLNSRSFIWWGNGRTVIDCTITTTLTLYSTDNIFFLEYIGTNNAIGRIKINQRTFLAQFCRLQNLRGVAEEGFHTLKNSTLVNCTASNSSSLNLDMQNCILINSPIDGRTTFGGGIVKIENNIIIGLQAINTTHINTSCDYNNFTNLAIPTTNGANSHSINNASTGQTVADYFNNYDLGDFTAKLGSANLGAGFNNYDIGFSQGFSLYADDDVFKEANGAVLRNVVLSSGKLILHQANKYIQGATLTTVELDSSASSVDDYYNGLIFYTIYGLGSGQMREVLDYDGTTKTITIATLDESLDVTTKYTISGRITSAAKDFGRVFEICRNHFLGKFGAYAISPSMWTEYMAINPLIASFGMKYSKFNDLGTKSFVYFGLNGETLANGTIGDADDSYNFNGIKQYARYVQYDIPILANV